MLGLLMIFAGLCHGQTIPDPRIDAEDRRAYGKIPGRLNPKTKRDLLT